MNCIIPYNPGQPSARKSRTLAKWRKPPGKRIWAYNFPQSGSTADDAIDLSDAPTSDDLSIPKSIETTPTLGSSMAMPPLKLAVNGAIDPAGKASLTDDNYLDIDDMLSTTGNSGVKSALSQSIRSNDLELSHSEDNTPGHSGQATSCASARQSEEPFEDIHHVIELDGTNHDISNTEQAAERAILESLTGRPNGDPDINTALYSQQEPVLVQGGQSDYSCPLAHGPAATKGKEHIPNHWTGSVGDGEELEERTLDKKSSTRHTRSPSTSPEPIKRRRRTCSRIESEAEDASNAHHKISRKRTRIGKKPINSVQSATVPDGDWLIDGIVGERRGAKGREFMIKWKSSWVPAKDVNAEDCKQRWREQKRRLKTGGGRR